jgi:hypothetical protein
MEDGQTPRLGWSKRTKPPPDCTSSFAVQANAIGNVRLLILPMPSESTSSAERREVVRHGAAGQTANQRRRRAKQTDSPQLLRRFQLGTCREQGTAEFVGRMRSKRLRDRRARAYNPLVPESTVSAPAPGAWPSTTPKPAMSARRTLPSSSLSSVSSPSSTHEDDEQSRRCSVLGCPSAGNHPVVFGLPEGKNGAHESCVCAASSKRANHPLSLMHRHHVEPLRLVREQQLETSGSVCCAHEIETSCLHISQVILVRARRQRRMLLDRSSMLHPVRMRSDD